MIGCWHSGFGQRRSVASIGLPNWEKSGFGFDADVVILSENDIFLQQFLAKSFDYRLRLFNKYFFKLTDSENSNDDGTHRQDPDHVCESSTRSEDVRSSH